MSEQQQEVQQQAGTGNTPAGNDTPQTTGQPAPQQQPPQQEPEWLSGRLARAEEAARKKLLAEIGVDDPETAKSLLNADKERKDAEKTYETRFKERDQQYKALEANHKSMQQAFNAFLDAEIAAVPEQYKETATKLLEKVGDNPVLRLGVLQDLKPLFAQTQTDKRKSEDIDATAGTEKKKQGAVTEDEVRKTFRLGTGRR